MATTYTVKKGDTVWALSRRALEQSLGRKPTNAEIAAVVNKVSVPSGNRNLIYPGEKITIPVKTGSSGGGQVPTGRSERAQAERYAGQARQGGGSTRPSTPSKPKKRRGSDVATALVTGALVGGAVGAAAGSRKRKTKNAAAAAQSNKFANAAAKDRAGEKVADAKLKAGTPPRQAPKGNTSGKGKGASKAAKGPTKAQITSYNNARNALNSATTKEALDLAGKRISKTDLTESQKKALRDIYKKKSGSMASGASAAALAPKSGSKKSGSKSQGTKAKPGSAGRPKSDPARYVANYNKRIRNAKTLAELNKVKQAVKGSGALSGKDARSKLMDKIDKKNKTLKAVKSVKGATGQSAVPVMRGAAAKLATAGKGTTAGKAATAAAVLGGAAVKGVKKAAKKKSTRKKSASRRS